MSDVSDFDPDAEISYDQELQNEQAGIQFAHGAQDEAFGDAGCDTPLSSDTTGTHAIKRLRTERGFISKRTSSRADDQSCPALLSCTLTKHSAKFSPPLRIDGEYIANMDYYRDAMLLDRFPGEDTPAWYVWASCTHESSYDGSDMVILARVLDVMKHVDIQPHLNAFEEFQQITLCMEQLVGGRWATNDFGDEHESDDWDEASTRLRIMFHVPLMKRQEEVDLRYEEETEHTTAAIFTTEAGDLVIGTDRYRRQRESILFSTELRVEFQADDDYDLHLSFAYESEEPWMTLKRYSRTLEPNEGDYELLCVPTSPEPTRNLLYLPEWSESDLSRARLKHAPTYISPVWPALVAASVRKKPPDNELWVSLLIRHVGEKVRYDTPDAEEGSPTTWVWDFRQLWHSNEPAVRTVLKAAATELCDLAASLPEKKIYGDVLLRAYHEYKGYIPVPKKLSDADADDDGGDNEDNDNNEDDNEDGDDGGGNQGDDNDADDGGGNQGDDNDADDESGFGLLQPVSPALQEILTNGEMDIKAVYFSMRNKTFTTSMSNNNRFLEARVSTLLPWVSERGFAASFQETMSVAWQNGVQDFFPPYAWHQPTPLDRVCSRLPYYLAPDPKTPEEITALEKFVITDRYEELLFRDRAVALREADKDAVMFLGDPSVMAEANIRVHVGPYDGATRSFGSRAGKNLRLTMLKQVYCNLLDDAKGAGFLSLAMVPGKAYSMFSGIEFKLGVWVDEAQNATSKHRGVQPWNPGLVLKLAPGSERSTFQYRVEHGKEKTVKLKLQAINVSSNQVNIPCNPGFISKTEASPYPRIGKSTMADVEAARAAGIDAFLIRNECLDTVKQGREKLARYYVNRAIAIKTDATKAHPRTQQHIDATATILACSGSHDLLDEQEAISQLTQITDEWLRPCDGGRAQLDFNEDRVDWPKRFQLAGSRRCYCNAATGKACHFTVTAFAARLEAERNDIFAYYVRRANQTATLTQRLQKCLGLDDVPPKKANAYPRGAIWGWTLQPQALDEQAVNHHAPPSEEHLSSGLYGGGFDPGPSESAADSLAPHSVALGLQPPPPLLFRITGAATLRQTNLARVNGPSLNSE